MTQSGWGNVHIQGLSGKMYTFRAYPLETSFAEFGAVYFITGRSTQRDGKIAHTKIFCGETGNMSLSPYSEHSATLRAHRANCICILPVEEELSRRGIQQDIHQNYKLLGDA